MGVARGIGFALQRGSPRGIGFALQRRSPRGIGFALQRRSPREIGFGLQRSDVRAACWVRFAKRPTGAGGFALQRGSPEEGVGCADNCCGRRARGECDKADPRRTARVAGRQPGEGRDRRLLESVGWLERLRRRQADNRTAETRLAVRGGRACCKQSIVRESPGSPDDGPLDGRAGRGLGVGRVRRTAEAGAAKTPAGPSAITRPRDRLGLLSQYGRRLIGQSDGGWVDLGDWTGSTDRAGGALLGWARRRILDNRTERV
jgi:hypothetical protein